MNEGKARRSLPEGKRDRHASVSSGDSKRLSVG